MSQRLQRLMSPATQVRMAWICLLLGMVIYVLWFGDQVLLRYTTFKATGFDLGNYDQAVWNTLHGRFFQFTNHGSNWYGHPIRLAQHVEPILIPLSLLYLPFPDARTLLITQTLALTSGALPIFLLTRRFIPSLPFLAVGMVAAYFLSPAILGAGIFDFHAVTLAIPFFLYAMLALTYRRYGWFVCACVLAASCKEEIPLVMALLGLLVIWKYKLPRLGLFLFVLGVTWFLLAFLVIMPHFNVGASQSNFWYRYAALGATPGEALLNVLVRPWTLILFFVTLNRIYYLFSLTRSPGFFAVLAPEWLLPALPGLAINLLSTERFQHSGVFHYNASIMPFVMVASIHGLRRLVLLWHNWRGETLEAEQIRESQVLMVLARQPDKARTFTQAIPGSALFVVPVKRLWQWIRLQTQKLVRRNRVQRVTKPVRSWLARCWQGLQQSGRSRAQKVSVARLQWYCVIWIVAMIGLNYLIMHPPLGSFWADHRPSEREQRIEQVLALIPEDAPISASGTLNPHLSERRYITVFPELTVATMDGSVIPVEYIVVDLQNVSPEAKGRSAHFMSVLNRVLHSQQFRVVMQSGGVLLIIRNTP